MRIGTLVAREGGWDFAYSDKFRRSKLRPLVLFPDTIQRYHTTTLWPFFRLRIPSLRRDAIRKIVDRERINKSDEVQMLRRFGRRTVSDPFELLPS
jgi:HipA-like protein